MRSAISSLKRGARNLPVMFLVHIAKGYGVREKLVEVLGTAGADFLVKSDWQLSDFSVRLDFRSVLVLNRPSVPRAFFELTVGWFALVIFGAHRYFS